MDVNDTRPEEETHDVVIIAGADGKSQLPGEASTSGVHDCSERPEDGDRHGEEEEEDATQGSKQEIEDDSTSSSEEESDDSSSTSSLSSSFRDHHHEEPVIDVHHLFPTLDELVAHLNNTASGSKSEIDNGLISSFASSRSFATEPFQHWEIREIAKAARQNTKITELPLVNMNYNYSNDVSEYWAALSELPNLKKVRVVFQNIHDNDNDIVDFRPLVALLHKKPCLKELSIYFGGDFFAWDRPRSLASRELSRQIRKLRDLKSLRLSRAFFSNDVDEQLLSAVASLPNVRTLELLACECSGNLGAWHPTRSLNISAIARMSTLQSLRLQAVEVNTGALIQLISSNKKLKSCQLIQCSYLPKHQGLGKLATAVTSHPTLKTLDFNLSTDALPHQRTDFVQNFSLGIASTTTLKRISHISVGDEHADLDRVLDAVSTQRSLRKFALTFYPDTMLQPLHFSSLSRIMSRNRRLKHVTLRGTGLPKDACHELRQGLASERSSVEAFDLFAEDAIAPLALQNLPLAACCNPSLKRIRLIHGGKDWYHYEDIFPVIKGLAGNTSLEYLLVTISRCICSVVLNLENNQRQSFVDAVSQIYGLKYLYLDLVEVDPICGKMLQPILKLNKFGRVYMINDNTKENGVQLLSKVTDDIDCLFHHVRENCGVLFMTDPEAENSEGTTVTSPALSSKRSVGAAMLHGESKPSPHKTRRMTT